MAASAAGTIFEWYDFFIFGSLAAIIAKHFFASAGDTQGYIFALLTFAAGFAVRPLGAIVFGSIGDRTGRKRAFLVTITIMGLATLAVGFLPDYAQMGIAAPYALVGLRVLQGFAIGGEYGGAAIYVAEHSSKKRRGASTGWIQTSATLGLLLALVVILATRKTLGRRRFRELGLADTVPPVGALCSRSRCGSGCKLHESPLFKKMLDEKRGSKAPLSETFLHWSNLKIVLIVLIGLLMSQGAVWYAAQFYTQFYLERVVRVEPAMVNALIIAVTIASAPLHMFFAWISDYIGRKPVMLFGLGLAAICYFPGFQMLTEAVNPALTAAASKSPVTVAADPAGCSFQFDLIGKAKFVSSCDIAKGALASAGVPYRNATAAARACERAGRGRDDRKPRGRGARRGRAQSGESEIRGRTQSRARRVPDILLRRKRATSTSHAPLRSCSCSSWRRLPSTARRPQPSSNCSPRASATRRSPCPITSGWAGSAASCRRRPSPSWPPRAISMRGFGIP